MKNVIFVLVLSSFYSIAKTQSLAINTDATTADSSALLDVKSTLKGILIPRMEATDKVSIPNPATGLLVYQVNDLDGIHYNKGTPATPMWVKVGEEKTTVAFSATTSVIQNFTASIGAKVLFLTEEYDVAGNFTPGATSQFTAPSAGIYHFDVKTVLATATNQRCDLSILVNGVSRKLNFDYQTGAFLNLQLSADIYLLPADVVEVRLVLSAGGQQLPGLPSHIWFNGHKIN
ncbi:MAG TPA: hypothetical protein VK484_02745 [Ferruginibacter sp.]|nr:hypothetical protein [Ferruginibacter sp.]